MKIAIRCRTISSASEALQSRSPATASERGQCLYRKLSALGATGGSVWETLDGYFSQFNFIHKQEIWSSVKELRRFGKFDHALQVMEWMEARNISYFHSDHSMRIDLIAKTKGIVEAETYVNNLKPHEKNKLTYGSLLNCYCMGAMEEKALQLFSEMARLGFVTNALPFGNLMSMYMKMGRHKKVISLEAEMRQMNIYMSTYTYNLLMQSYAALNDIEGAERILNQVEVVDSEKVDWTTYSNLATIYVKAGLFEKAKVALVKLETKMRPGSRETFHFVISLYAGIGQTDDVYRVWNSLKSVHSSFNNTSYLVMMHALNKLDDIEGLRKNFEEWQNGYSYHDTRLVVAVVTAYLQRNKYDEAMLVFEDTTKRTKDPLFSIRESFIFYYLKNNQIDLALSYFDANVSEAKNNKRLLPKSKLVSALLSYYEKVKDIDGAERVLEILKPIRCPDANEYRSLLKVYVAADKCSSKMRSRLKMDGLEIIDPEFNDLVQWVCPE